MSSSRYLFVAYCDADYESVDNIFLDLYKKGIEVKDPKDYSATDTEYLISEAEAVLYVISPYSVSSSRIQNYLQLADQSNKHIIPYYLCSPEEAGIPRSMLMQMDGSASIPAYEYSSTESLAKRAYEEISPYFADASATQKSKKKPVLTVAAVAFILIAVFAIYSAWVTPAKQEKMLQHVKNSTVQIYAVGGDLEAYLEGDEDSITYAGTGSGFFISTEGLIATNYHVVDDGDYYCIKTTGDSEELYVASLVSYDEKHDIALMRIDENYIAPEFLVFSKRKVKTGEAVYVAGYPKGIDLTLSNGIISNDEHYAANDEGYYFLMTAAVSHGNSGGPVVDKSGKVIGIATAKYIEAENMNLVRPVEYLEELYKNVK